MNYNPELAQDIRRSISDVEELINYLGSIANKLSDESDLDNYIDLDDCEEIKTALGTIHIHNQSKNLKLEEEIENFIEQLKKKYN
jgi:hypothetical protein